MQYLPNACVHINIMYLIEVLLSALFDNNDTPKINFETFKKKIQLGLDNSILNIKDNS